MSSPLRSVSQSIGQPVNRALAGLARLRRGKAVHPRGVVHEARLVVHGADAAPAGATLFERPAEHVAIVRFSRSLGVPRPLPDLLGASVRLPDVHGPGRHQDLLMVTSVDAPVLHHVFLPTRDPRGRPYSSSLPYRTPEGERFLVGLVPADDDADAFDLCVAPLLGRFAAVGRLHVGERLPHALDAMHFNPFNTGGGIEPSGPFNEWRRDAYPRSQRAWARRAASTPPAQDHAS